MKTIYLVRHAEPNFENHDDKSRELSFNGLIDRNNVTKYFENIEIEGIYTSPYKRAVDTIKPCSENKNLNIILVDDFRERAVGRWLENFDEFAQKQWSDFNYKIENGENLNEVQVRNIRALSDITNKKAVIVSGHGTAISTIINFYFKKFGYDDFKKLKMPFIVKLKLDNDLKFIEYELIDIKTNSSL